LSTFNSFPAVIDNPLAIDPIDLTDADALIDALEQFKKVEGELQAAKTFCIRALVAMTDSDARTRRVQGRRRPADVERGRRDPGTDARTRARSRGWCAMSVANFFPIHHQVGVIVLKACLNGGLPYHKAHAVANEVYESVRAKIDDHAKAKINERLEELLEPSAN